MTTSPSSRCSESLAFPALLPRLGFWPTLLACVVLTVVCFGLFAAAVRHFGIELL